MSWVRALGTKRTNDELAKRRAATVEAWGEHNFTCDNCLDKWTCDFSFDPYNTDGDCLAEK